MKVQCAYDQSPDVKGLTYWFVDFKKAFELFDKNKDGRIDRDELRCLFTETDCNITDQQLQAFMDRLDTDGKFDLV